MLWGVRYAVCYRGESGGEEEKKREVGVGLAEKQTLGNQTAARKTELIVNRLLKVAPDLRGRINVLLVVVGYALTETHDATKENPFWVASMSAVKLVPSHEQ